MVIQWSFDGHSMVIRWSFNGHSMVIQLLCPLNPLAGGEGGSLFSSQISIE